MIYPSANSERLVQAHPQTLAKRNLAKPHETCKRATRELLYIPSFESKLPPKVLLQNKFVHVTCLFHQPS